MIYGFFPLVSWSPGAEVERGGHSKNNSGPFPAPCYCRFKGSCRISWDFKKNPAFSLLWGSVFILFRTLGHQGRRKENTHTHRRTHTETAANSFELIFFPPFLSFIHQQVEELEVAQGLLNSPHHLHDDDSKANALCGTLIQTLF